MWMKHRKSKEEAESGEDVFVNRLSKKGWLIVLGSFVVGAFIYAELLTLLSAQQVGIESMAVVLSVIAQVLMIQRYAEQWVIWMAVNILTITLCVITMVMTGGQDGNMIVMWTAFVEISVDGYVNGVRISKLQKDNKIKTTR